MKRLVAATLLTSLLVTGCGAKTDNELEKDTVENIVYNFQEEFEKCKEKEYENLDFSECSGRITDIEKLYKLQIDEYAYKADTVERIEAFEEYCQFYFQDYDSSNIYFGSGTEGLINDGGFNDYPKLNRYREQIESGEIDVGYLMYVDFENSRYLWTMALNSCSPCWMSNGLVFDMVKDEGERVSSWNTRNMTDPVAKYYNDGTCDDKSYNLLDGEVTIGEAISYVENEYLDTLPFDYGEEASLIVTSVNVYEIQENTYAYAFDMTFAWNNIAFDSTSSFVSTESVSKIFLIADALMAEKDSIDEFSGWTMPYITSAEELTGELYTLESAVDIVSESFSKEVTFKVLTVSMTYQGIYEDLSPTEAKGSASPAWMFQLYNTNDGLYYKVYVDVLTGKIDSFSYTQYDQ